MSSADTEGQDNLLTVRYKRCQPESPVFLSQFDGVDQSVDIKISTFIFKAAPEPVLAVYDFIMTTFVPGPVPNQRQQQNVAAAEEGISLDRGKYVTPVVAEQQQAAQKIRVLVTLASVQGISFKNVSCGPLTLECSYIDE
jgi:vacuolar protein sorting-associated protein 13A/C